MPAFGASRSVRLLFVVVACFICHVSTAYAQATCANTIGRIVSLQGQVQVQRARTVEWISVKGLDVPLCIGDQIRTGLLSRAGLYIGPETIVRLDQNTTLEFVEQTPEQTVVALRREEFNRVIEKRAGQCGVGYFITRFPRKLKVRTPFYNAVVEGTEFQVAMSCDRGELAVFEGKVAAEKLDAPGERVLVEGGQSTSVGAGETPAGIKALVRPADAVQWALYYLPLSDVKGLTEDALAQDCAALSAELRSGCTIRKAEYLLKVGRVAEARGQLESLSASEPNNGDVIALQSIIALVQNDKGQALSLATRATQAAPNAFRSFAALSYAQQAHFKLDDALASAQRAAQLAPTSALMKARTAELQLSLGKTRAAERDAKDAVRLDANESRAHLILGFVHLAQIDTKAAKADFGKAIELDSTEPLARLGLGLATIREGKLQEGREQIEIAVALDPTNSLVRSYVGKAYYEENSKARDGLAATQFGLAKSLDPKDPTPWFYDAILKQTQNRPVEALQDLQQSIALNDNRAVYRSRLALDEDRAARSAFSSSVYERLGLPAASYRAATEALFSDPANFSAHRQAANSLVYVPRHEIGRASERLQATLLSPDSAFASDLKISNTNLSLLPGYQVTPPVLSDPSSMFERDRIGVSLFGAAGNLGTQSLEGSALGRISTLSGNIGGLDYNTNGFRPNNDLDTQIVSGLVQNNFSESFALQAELRQLRTKQGDLALNFDPDAFDPNFRRTLDDRTMRLGLRAHLSPETTVLMSWQHADRDETVHTSSPGLVSAGALDTRGSQAELQLLQRWTHASLVAGYGYAQSRGNLDLTFDFSPLPCLFPSCNISSESIQRETTVYAYGTWLPVDSLSLTAGLSYQDFYDKGASAFDRLNPKLGIVYRPTSGLSIRFAAFRTLTPVLVARQTLEPTQVAGFNQYFDDFFGTRSSRVGIGVDIAPTERFMATAELSARQMTKQKFDVNGVPVDENQDEMNAHLTTTFFITPHWVAGLKGELDRFTREDLGDNDIVPSKVRTAILTPSLRYFLPAGLFAAASMSVVNQKVDRLPTYSGLAGDSNFSVVDLALGWRLPNRMGSISLEVRNLFDTHFDYQDDNFRTAEPRQDVVRFIPARVMWLTGALRF